jgi:PadR family transcriptional regulator PadR
MTIPTQLVLQLLLADPARDRYGFQIGQEAGLPSGTVHPILARLEALGWVSSRWEDLDPAEAGRPARRYYRVTAEGESAARAALARAHRPTLIRRPFPLGGQP